MPMGDEWLLPANYMMEDQHVSRYRSVSQLWLDPAARCASVWTRTWLRRNTGNPGVGVMRWWGWHPAGGFPHVHLQGVSRCLVNHFVMSHPYWCPNHMSQVCLVCVMWTQKITDLGEGQAPQEAATGPPLDVSHSTGKMVLFWAPGCWYMLLLLLKTCLGTRC